MRLLNVETLELKLFTGSDIPDYAILSHTWGGEEITFEDLAKEPISNETATARQKKGFTKVQGACSLAKSHRYEWIWIDSCNIDKSSSSELQEAINSMWNWYKNAGVCYAYIEDVPSQAAGWGEQFRQSRWFTRAWTLQELIAPWIVEFRAADWTPIGTKLIRLEEVYQITGVATSALKYCDTTGAIAAEVMSWMAHRHATREEDLAYSLMGFFDINMPMLYGEGGNKAFLRLQSEIFKQKPDHSLLLPTKSLSPGRMSLLAEKPSQFCQRENCKECPGWQIFPKQMTYRELRIKPLPHALTNNYDLHLRRGGQDVTLVILTSKEALDRISDSSFVSGPNIAKSEAIDFNNSHIYVAVLEITNYFNHHVGILLQRAKYMVPGAESRFTRYSKSFVLLSPGASYPPPTRAFILYQPESNSLAAPRVFKISVMFFELQSSTFEIDLISYSAPRLSDLLVPANANRWHHLNTCRATNKTIEIRTIRNYWEFSFTASQPFSEHSPAPIQITLSGWPGESKRCRIKNVGIRDKNLAVPFKALTSIDFSSDQYKLEADHYPCVLISVRPVPRRNDSNSHFLIGIEPI
jgi:hypothetical protein